MHTDRSPKHLPAMARHPFDPSFDQLPERLPVFPLAGALLLPHGKLPLNIFEPRYLNLMFDALATPTRLIGMIQPRPVEAREEDLDPPRLFAIGCAGRITSFAETDDGRLLITLTGISRFAVRSEDERQRGYRLVQPDWRRFVGDLRDAAPLAVNRPRLIAGLKAYIERQNARLNWDAIDELPDDSLVTSLSMLCPFSPTEKQALLEAEDLSSRAETLTALLEMAVGESPGGEPARH